MVGAEDPLAIGGDLLQHGYGLASAASLVISVGQMAPGVQSLAVADAVMPPGVSDVLLAFAMALRVRRPAFSAPSISNPQGIARTIAHRS